MNIITYPERNTWADLLKRPTLQTESLRETVLEILNRIKFEGDKAVLEYEEKIRQGAIAFSVSKRRRNCRSRKESQHRTKGGHHTGL